MVRLSKIYTKTGDQGTTALGDGTRLPKHHLRIAAYGTVDELSSVLGLLLAHGVPDETAARLRAIQNDLFDLGADLCVPGVSEKLEPLSSFLLPGGQPAAAWLHLARTVCRRAERLVSELAQVEAEIDRVNPEVLRYLNRLSDLLFQMSRQANDWGKEDVLWKPGGGRS